MRDRAEAVIVGGGINGCCIALALARRGLRPVVLLEKGHLASGPTGRSSGLVRQHYSHVPLAEMARDSLQVWRNFAGEIGGECGFTGCGVVFFGGAAESAGLRATAAGMRRAGIRAEVLDAGQLRQLDPALHCDAETTGVWEPDGGYADPALATRSIAAAAQALGVAIRQKTELTGIQIAHGRVTGVTTSGGAMDTPMVVNAAGPWGARVAAMAGAHIPMRASRHAVIVLRRPETWRGATPVWGDLAGGWYYKPDGGGGLLVGSLHDAEEDTEAAIEEAPAPPSYAEIEACAAATLARFPVMAGGEALRGWSGLYDVTPDWQPVLDAVPGVAGFFCATGFSGSGFKIAPAVGEIMADLVTSGGSRRYDLHLFRYSRFEQQASSRGAYRYGIIG